MACQDIQLEYLEALFKRHQRDNGVYRVLWIKKAPAVPDGENYLSTVSRITIGVVLGSGKKRTLSVIVKTPLEKEGATYQWSMESGIFIGEIKIYTNLLHKMSELMYEFDDKRESLWPKLVGHESKMIIFEDLKQFGFKVTDRTLCHDIEHSKLVVRSLARFHAMSKILLKRRFISSGDVQRYALLVNVDFVDKLFGNGLKILTREMKTWGDEWADIRTRILKFSDTVGEKLEALNNSSEDNFNVINHGDCWVCNLMFKYDPYENIPIDLRFVDFQFVHYQSYGWDLTYYLYTSLLGDLRRKHYNDLLTAYHKSLSDTLLLYKYPEHEIPSLDDVHKEMERLKLFAMGICTLTHAIMTMPVKNAYNMNEAMKPDTNINYGYNLEIFRGRYKDEIGPDLRRFAEMGIY
ncbi:hypothetical protein O3M35_001100 [Rhynocoris fuscipes]|uniref:CHK kinase-like domain-containing protein n=1 Tax=Rhynocoris fuscipes TaxID=488301 RepID=A0AAW1DS22_9HEMI